MRFLSLAFLLLPLTSLAQENLTVSDFYLKQSQGIIEMNPLDERENQLLKKISTKEGFNQQYLVDEDTYFSTNTDAILARSSARNLVEARKDLFRGLEFNREEGNFKFPFPILSQWDILPHPPIQKLMKPMQYYTKTYLPNQEYNLEMLSEKFNRELNDLTQSDLTFGNQVSPLQNRQVFIEMKKMIFEAREYVLISNMFITCDASVIPMVDIMEQKVKAGIPVHMIVERVFALKYSKCLKKLKSVGVNLFYNDNMLKLKKRLVYHNKFCVSDNRKAVVMGSNIFDSEINSTGFNHMFRDSGVLLSGPVVTDLALEWIGLAKFVKAKKSKKLLGDIESKISKIRAIEKTNGLRGIDRLKEKTDLNGMCRVVLQAPHKSMTAMNDLYFKLVSAAKKSVFLSTPRLPEDIDGTEEVKAAKIYKLIYEHAKNDKDFHVDIMTNNKLVSTDVKSDNFQQTGFLTTLYKLFVKMEDTIAIINNVRQYFGGVNKLDNFDVWTYLNFYHSKTLLVDNTLNAIGSYNVNKLSDDTSFEMSVVCHDKSAIEDAQKSIILDLINSVPLLE